MHGPAGMELAVWLYNSFGYWLHSSVRSTLESVVTLSLNMYIFYVNVLLWLLLCVWCFFLFACHDWLKAEGKMLGKTGFEPITLPKLSSIGKLAATAEMFRKKYNSQPILKCLTINKAKQTNSCKKIDFI